MADDFTLLDHIAPYVPCLGLFRRSRIFLLPSPPASTSNLATTGISSRGDPDLLSLHSNIGQDHGRHPVTDTEHSLSRWQLLQSWWNTSTTRGDRKRRQALHTSDDAHDGEENAQELLLSTASSRPSPQKRHSSSRGSSNSPRPKLGKQRDSSRYSDSAHTASSDETRSSGSGRKHKRGQKRDMQRAYSDYTESTIDEEDAQSQSTAPTSVHQDDQETGKDTMV